MLYTTLTHKLVDEQQKLSDNKCIIKDLFYIDHQAQTLPYLPTNFIVDEVSLTGPGIIEYIRENFPYARINCCGD